MKKNIIIIILSALLITFVVYAQIKANEAYQNKVMADEHQRIAEENRSEAMRQSEIATEWAAQSMKNMKMAEELGAKLQACQGN